MKEKKKKFYISFSSENRNYFAGKDIVGAVCLDTDDNINLKSKYDGIGNFILKCLF